MTRNDHTVEKEHHGHARRDVIGAEAAVLWGAIGAASTGHHGGGLAAMLLARHADEMQRLDANNAGEAGDDDTRYTILHQFVHFMRNYREYRRLCRLAGRRLDIPYHKAHDLLAEARRHGWLEAEKAGRDIWTERSPKDPEAEAFRDWFLRHYRSWRDHHERQWAAE